MKITKKQLKQIIKEELAETYKGLHSKLDYEQTLAGSSLASIEDDYVSLIRELGARTVIKSILDGLDVEDEAHSAIIKALQEMRTH